MRIGIAIVKRDGCYLIGKRADGPLADYWEFPGGKCRPGESPEECAVRECREETGLKIEVQRLRRTVHHHYAHGAVELHFYDCQVPAGQESDAPSPPYRWVRREQLADYAFPAANDTVLRDLLNEHAAAQ